MLNFEIEKMSDEFTKHHIKNLPFDAVIHHFTAKDKGSPHDHPFGFISHILWGGYAERVYTVDDDGSWESEIIDRLPGTVHHVEATHIHEIIELPEGECWTLIIPQPKTRESKFWDFSGKIARSRAWYEGDFE